MGRFVLLFWINSPKVQYCVHNVERLHFVSPDEKG